VYILHFRAKFQTPSSHTAVAQSPTTVRAKCFAVAELELRTATEPALRDDNQRTNVVQPQRSVAVAGRDDGWIELRRVDVGSGNALGGRSGHNMRQFLVDHGPNKEGLGGWDPARETRCRWRPTVAMTRGTIQGRGSAELVICA
jgi:hypothetical protein